MKIISYTICKDEEKHVDRYMDHLKDADQVIILDTGSSDNSVQRLLDRGAIVHQKIIKPWRFDTARNELLNLLPDDVDVCMVIDLDECIQDGWRKEIERVWTAGVTRLWYWFEQDGIVFKHNRIHSRKGYRWRNVIHEAIYPISDENAVMCNVKIVHKPDPSKPRDRTELMEASIIEQPNDIRLKLWLALDHLHHRRFARASEICELLLENHSIAPSKDRAYACIIRSKCSDREKWLWRACVEGYDYRDAWYELTKFYYENEQYTLAYHAAIRALSIKNRQFEFYDDVTVWGDSLHLMAAVSCLQIGLMDEAGRLLKDAQLAFPDSVPITDLILRVSGHKITA